MTDLNRNVSRDGARLTDETDAPEIKSVRWAVERHPLPSDQLVFPSGSRPVNATILRPRPITEYANA